MPLTDAQIILNARIAIDEAQAHRDVSRIAGRMQRDFAMPLGRISSDVHVFQKSLDAATARVLAFGASASVLFSFLKGTTALANSFIDVEKKLTDINVILRTTDKGLASFGAQLFKVAKDTGQSFETTSKAAVEFSRQGLGLEQTLKRTRDALILTRLSGLDVESSVTALTATVNSFSNTLLSTTQIVNKLAKVDAEFAVSSKDLAEAISRVGSSAEDVGVNFDQLIALVTSVKQITGRDGPVIGNALKTIFTRIQRSDTLEQLELLGVTVKNTARESLPAIDILQNLATTYEKVGKAQRSQIAEQVGGVYQINILKAALKDLSKESSIYRDALDKSTNATNEATLRNFDLNRTLAANINRVKENLRQLAGQQGGPIVDPLLRSFLDPINNILESAMEKPGENAGMNFAKSFIKGFGDFINTGLILLVTDVFRRTMQKFGGQGVGAIRSFYDGTDEKAKLKQQLQEINNIVAANRMRLAGEEKVLQTLQAQNVVRASGLTTVPFGGITGPITGFGRTGTGLGPSISMPKETTMGAPVGSIFSHALTNTASIMGQLGYLTKRVNYLQSTKGFIENHPTQRRAEIQMLQNAISQRREELGSINQSRELRDSLLGGTRIDKENYIISGPAARRRQEAASIANRVKEGQLGVGLRSSLQTQFDELKNRDIREQQELQQRLDNLARRDSLLKPASGMFFSGSARRQLSKLDPDALDEINTSRRMKMQNYALAGSLVTPGLVDLLGTSGLPETRGGRITGAISSGIGNTVSSGLLGFGIGNPLMGGLMAGFTALSGISKVFKEMNSIFPEMQRAASEAANALARTSERLDALVVIAQKVSDIKAGNIKPSQTELTELGQSYSEALAGLSPYERSRISGLVTAGNVSGTQDISKELRKGKERDLLRKSLGSNLTGFIEQGKGKDEVMSQLLSMPSGSGSFAEYLNSQRAQSLLGGVGLSDPQAELNQLNYFDPRRLLYINKLRAGPQITNKENIYRLFEEGMGYTDRDSLLSNMQRDPGKFYEFIQSARSQSAGMARNSKQFKAGLIPTSDEPPFSIQKRNFERSLAFDQSDFLGENQRMVSRQLRSFDISALQNQTELEMNRGSISPYNFIQREAGLRESSQRRGIIGQISDMNLGAIDDIGQFFKSIKDIPKSPQDIERFKVAQQTLQGMVGSFNVKDTQGLQKTVSSVIPDLFTSHGLNLFSAGQREKMGPQVEELTLKLKDRIRVIDDLIEQESELSKLTDIEIQQKLMDIDVKRLARIDAQGFEFNIRKGRARTDEFVSRGLLFSNERADQNLTNNIDDVRLGGKPTFGMVGSALSDQFRYGAKEAYRDLIQGAADVGDAMKSSFRDAFRTFIDGSQSAGEALRSLGLSFAGKLMDLAAQSTTNLIFGAAQSFGNALFSKHPAKAATGGYVTGGSGIRDDVPAMLNEGSFVLRKSSVQKYGVGRLNALNFANGGNVSFPSTDPNLSNFALTDENNPQNALRMEREREDLIANIRFSQAMQAYKNARKQVWIGAGFNIAAQGLGQLASAGANKFANRSGSGDSMLNNYNAAMKDYNAATGGLITNGGVRRYASGGNVDSIPALLTGGEYVMNRSAVSRHGVGFMHKLNRGELPGFDSGGFVGETIPGGGSRNGGDLNDSISRLISSNEKLRTSKEKEEKTNKESSVAQPLVGSFSITINMEKGGNIKEESSSKTGEKQSDNKQDMEKANKMVELIKAAVLETLDKEMRNGGSLEQTFEKRR